MRHVYVYHNHRSKENNNNNNRGDDADNDETPRAPSLYGSAPRLRSDASSSNSDLFSERSGTSSPTKQLSAMKLHDDGFRVGKLLERPLAGALDRLVKDIRFYTYNVGVISAELKVLLTPSAHLTTTTLKQPAASTSSSGRPDVSIIHTNYSPLVDLPVAVSVETKKGTDNWDRAVLQMGTWQAAHLRRLASTADPNGSSGGIGFLPGIIIMGHFCHFVVMVREEGVEQPVLLSSILAYPLVERRVLACF
ncbi:hypothetical protein QBC33DRAFT_601560 [Phialemonium atrogriseum]|uniref:PD-(D/E)XK nuclease-like domain-containing protein n=1 Tax=Phialemonium atrogriseum TaxID=1093897 RepID=A0AAJ0FBG6_9PEZI|nr:uncharacterized protein QBC33DRAFT_601560 [Phialemonium atrogriseum]KAK1762446.1 hypothetical protein QBC33DRAFT_601560 [Phialemonium atrogriseum]